MSTIASFKDIGNKHGIYKGKDCMKKFSESLREHSMKVINFKKKKTKSLTNKQQESHENAKICYIYKANFEDNNIKDEKSHKVRDHYHYTCE